MAARLGFGCRVISVFDGSRRRQISGFGVDCCGELRNRGPWVSGIGVEKADGGQQTAHVRTPPPPREDWC